MPKFSILTPVHIWSEERLYGLNRAIKSVQSQTFSDYEHIIVDDGSVLEFQVPTDSRIRLFRIPHQERVVAVNHAYQHAAGDWICWLDSDDAYLQEYLEILNEAIQQWPEYSVFNFGAIVVNSNYSVRLWDAFKPARAEVGHEIFGGGTIMAGTFIYRKEATDTIGHFRDTCSPWDFSTEAQEEFPEIKPFFTVTNEDHPKGYPKELGNPWGQDFYMFYKLTRKYHSQVLNTHLYINYRFPRNERLKWK